MFPRLTPVQWALLVVFLFFYGFAVFALTRDWYLRHPPRPTAAVTDQAALGQRMQAALGGATEPPLPPEAMNDPALLAREADRLFVAERYQEAIPLYRRLLTLQPDDPDTLNDLGLALHYTGDSAAGLTQLRAATTADPSGQRLWLSLGFVSAQTGDANGARAALTQARDLDPASGIGREAERLLGLLPAAPGP